MAEHIEDRVARLERLVAELQQHHAGAASHETASYEIRNGFLLSPTGAPVDFQESPNAGGAAYERTLVVIHFTAGRGFDYTSRHFMKDASDASAHFLVSKAEGDRLRQFVSTKQRAWHVGKSEWKGRGSCNGYALGIELDNAGPLDAEGLDRWGQRPAQVVELAGKLWEGFPDHQIGRTVDLILAMRVAHPTLLEVIGHQHCATPAGRKIDPGPAFPWATLAQELEGTGLEVIAA